MASPAESDRAVAADRGRWSDERVESLMGRLLQVGVVASAALALAGGLLYLHRHGGEAASFRYFRGEPADFRHVRGIAREALALRSRGIIALGLLVLIATPIARVIFALIAFLRQRDWVYVGITAIVLAVLGYSLLSG